MRNWTWMVLVASGALAWACGGDDDNDDGGPSTSAGGTGGDGGGGGSDPTTNTTNGGGNGGSGGSGGSVTTTGSVGGSGGSGGTTTTGTDTGGATSSGGSAGGGGESGGAGMAGADTGGNGGTGGTGNDPTLQSACEAACTAMEASACPDSGCVGLCVALNDYAPQCEEEYIEWNMCVAEEAAADFDCSSGSPFSENCYDLATVHYYCAYPPS